MNPTGSAEPGGGSRLGSSGAACFWLLLGVATTGIDLLALMSSIGALVVFGPWAIVSFAIGARLLVRPRDPRVHLASASLAVVSLALSILGIVGSLPDWVVVPVLLAILSAVALAYSVLAIRSRPETGDASAEPSIWVDAAIWAQGAALVLLAGGFATVVGSFATWGSCSKEPCEGSFGLFHIWERSGLGFGPGVVTAALGLLIVILGIDATRDRSHVAPAEVSLIAATVALLVVGGFVVRVYFVPLYITYGPIDGLIVVAGGATAALLASLRLRLRWRSGAGVRDAPSSTAPPDTSA